MVSGLPWTYFSSGHCPREVIMEINKQWQVQKRAKSSSGCIQQSLNNKILMSTIRKLRKKICILVLRIEDKKSSVNIHNTFINSETYRGWSPSIWQKIHQCFKESFHKPKLCNQSEKFNPQTVPVATSSYLNKREKSPVP